ncbi:10274_t:CDS:2 [Cetraspora pellucida]|uniref:10274_t:CDS:1 n=1 Tax=Cetraspora pellucida TaxID=1433469 RepID=A0ACA9JXD0_9GLOM|nr:10274_t:CDS:2 [Cetraspora pellucida]
MLNNNGTVPMDCDDPRNQFQTTPGDVAKAFVHNALEASTNFVPFAPLLDIFLRLGDDIVTLYQKAEHNKRLCNYLTKRVNSAVAAVKDLEIRKQDSADFFMEQANLQLIKDFLKCMLDVRKFITDVSQLGSFGNFFQAGNIVQKYKDLSSRFDGYMTSLNLAINKATYSYVQNINHNIEELRKFDLEVELKSIKSDLVEMKKFMFDMADGKTGSDETTFTDIKRIRELNSRYQREQRKGTEITIEPANFLKLDDYEPKYESEPRGKTIHCRWNGTFLLEYAFKEIPQISDEQTEKEIGQQVAILKELKNSEHIIKFYGIAKSSDALKFYLVTEWMENGTLQEYYKKFTLSWTQKFEFAIDICRGIAFLNAVEILHHDIRGANILISGNHKAKIANFGLSRKFRDITRNIQVNLENVRYMSPEKLEHGDKKRYTVKCEIYSLGALLWEIAEEKVPYTKEGIDLQTIRDRVVKEKYREPFYSDVPKVWRDITYAALRHDPDFRPTISKIFTTLFDYHHKDEKRPPPPVDEFETEFVIDDDFMTVDAAIKEHRKPDAALYTTNIS